MVCDGVLSLTPTPKGVGFRSLRVIWGWFLRTHHPYLWQTLNLAFDSAETTKEWAMKLPTKLIEAYILNEALKRLPDIQL